MKGLFNEIGYSAGHEILDSKHYGIPQTRQRGYMVSLNEAALETAGLVPNFKTFFEILGNVYSRSASNTVENWMQKFDSIPLWYQHEAQGEARSVVPWDNCHAKHEDYRQEQGLGSGRPITDWRSTGVFKHPDHWRRGMKGFVERVHDVTDVSHLRGVLRGYDDRYYR